MPRPREYPDGSVQTAFRIDADVLEKLHQEVDARGLGRNRLVNLALREYLGLKPTGTRLKRPQARIEKASTPVEGKSTARQKPRLVRVGEEFQNR